MWQATMVWWALPFGITSCREGNTNLIGRSHKELDLTDQNAVKPSLMRRSGGGGAGCCLCGRYHGQYAVSC
jgi:hypothetical protein